ncbi:Vacuolar-sorting protein BRO1 [Linum perenne]
MRVPSPHSLSPLPAFSLVKPMPMNEMLDASKVKMFASLVPDNSAKSLSRYTEMVDDVIRTQAEQLQQGSELARVRLKEMDLPDSILVLEGSVALPQDLKEDVEAVQISGGPAGLEAELQQLKDLRRKEAAEDSQFRSQFGTRWTRPQSATLTKNLQDRLNRFAGNLKQAAESDARIERSVRENYGLMAILDKHPVCISILSFNMIFLCHNSHVSEFVPFSFFLVLFML